MFNLLFVIAILFVAARVFGQLATRLGSPRIVGEIIAGLLIAPFRSHVSLGSDEQLWLSMFLTFCGTAFLFVAGFEIDLTHLRRNFRSGFAIGSFGLIVPVLVGTCLVFFGPDLFVARLRGAEGVETWRLAATFATVLAVSAVPVIAKTLSDLGLLTTRLGTLTITSAIFDDVVGWIILTFAVGASNPWTSLLLGAIALGALLRASVPAESVEKNRAFGVAGGISRGVLAPIYFASLGWQVDVLASFDLQIVLVVLVLGFAAKWITCAAVARLSGIESREAWSIGAAMNTRGAMGIVFATAAREAHVISSELHIALITLAIATSLVSGPVIRRLMRPSSLDEKGLEKWQTE